MFAWTTSIEPPTSIGAQISVEIDENNSGSLYRVTCLPLSLTRAQERDRLERERNLQRQREIRAQEVPEG